MSQHVRRDIAHHDHQMRCRRAPEVFTAPKREAEAKRRQELRPAKLIDVRRHSLRIGRKTLTMWNIPSCILEDDMRAKLLTGTAALALAAATVMAGVGPASAAPWGWHHHGWGWGAAIAGGFIGGTLA